MELRWISSLFILLACLLAIISINVVATMQVPEVAPIQGGQSVIDLPKNFMVGSLNQVSEDEAPFLISISPDSADQGDSVSFTLTGRNFVSGSRVVLNLDAEEIEADNLQVISATEMSGNLTISDDATSGEWTVICMSPDGQVSNKDVLFIIYEKEKTEPYVSSISPKNGQRGTTVSFKLSGYNFLETAEVMFARDGSTLEAIDIQVQSPINLSGTIVIPVKAALGTWNVTVTQEGVKSNDDVVFTVNDAPPVIQKIWPNVGAKATNVMFTLVGKNFNTDAVVTLERNGTKVKATSIKIVSPTKLTGIFLLTSNHQAGVWDVVLRQGVLTSNKNIKFTVTESGPVISSIDPKSGRRGKQVNFTLTGRNFKPNSLVTLNLEGQVIKGSNVVAASATKMTGTFSIPNDAPLGNWNVVIRRGNLYSNNNILFKVVR